MCVCICVCVCVCASVHVCVYMCVCVYVCVLSELRKVLQELSALPGMYIFPETASMFVIVVITCCMLLGNHFHLHSCCSQSSPLFHKCFGTWRFKLTCDCTRCVCVCVCVCVCMCICVCVCVCIYIYASKSLKPSCSSLLPRLSQNVYKGRDPGIFSMQA